MAMSRELTIRVIEKYKSFPCLWKMSHPRYHNRQAKAAALDQLLILFKEQDPNADRDTVIKKITSMRGSFRKELNKVLKSIRSGADPTNVHVPRLWYYNYLRFLKTEELASKSPNLKSLLENNPSADEESSARESVDDTQSSMSPNPTNDPKKLLKRPLACKLEIPEKMAKTVNVPVLYTQNQDHETFVQFIAGQWPSSVPESNNDPTQANSQQFAEKWSSSSSEITKGPFADQINQFTDSIAKNIDTFPPDVPTLQHDNFGRHVAEKLRSLAPRMVPFCQKLISDAIFYAEIEALNLSSRIVTTDLHPEITIEDHSIKSEPE